MLLLVFTVMIAFGGLLAIELGQPSRPRDIAVWNDDIERRLLSLQTGRPHGW